jgi:hypothetical protein
MQRSQDAETLLRAALTLPYAGTVSALVPEANREGRRVAETLPV